MVPQRSETLEHSGTQVLKPRGQKLELVVKHGNVLHLEFAKELFGVVIRTIKLIIISECGSTCPVFQFNPLPLANVRGKVEQLLLWALLPEFLEMSRLAPQGEVYGSVGCKKTYDVLGWSQLKAT